MMKDIEIFPQTRFSYIMGKTPGTLYGALAWSVTTLLAYLSLDFALIVVLNFLKPALYESLPRLFPLPAAHMMVFVSGALHLAVGIFIAGTFVTIAKRRSLTAAIAGLVVGPAIVFAAFHFDGTHWVRTPDLHYYLSAVLGLLAGRLAVFALPPRRFM